MFSVQYPLLTATVPGLLLPTLEHPALLVSRGLDSSAALSEAAAAAVFPVLLTSGREEVAFPMKADVELLKLTG